MAVAPVLDRVLPKQCTSNAEHTPAAAQRQYLDAQQHLVSHFLLVIPCWFWQCPQSIVLCAQLRFVRRASV